MKILGIISVRVPITDKVGHHGYNEEMKHCHIIPLNQLRANQHTTP